MLQRGVYMLFLLVLTVSSTLRSMIHMGIRSYCEPYKPVFGLILSFGASYSRISWFGEKDKYTIKVLFWLQGSPPWNEVAVWVATNMKRHGMAI